VVVTFPYGQAILKLGAVAEIHSRASNRTRIYLRSGEGTVVITRKLKRPVTINKNGARQVVRYRMLTYPLRSGQNLLVGVYKDLTPKIKPDNAWQTWNQKWKTLSELHTLARRTTHKKHRSSPAAP
jgi:hypothetical protein